MDWVNLHAITIRFIAQITGGFVTSGIALMALFKTKELHVMVNNRLSQLLIQSNAASFSKGREEGVVVQQERSDKLAALQVIADDKSSITTVTKAQSAPSNEVKEQVVHAQTVVDQTVGAQTVQPPKAT